MKQRKLSFIYMNGFLKKDYGIDLPSTRKKIWDRVLKYKNNNLYLLCASAYTSYDLSCWDLGVNVISGDTLLRYLE